MNVKRFFARTSREAMAQIKAELGDDAVVLKTRKVNNGVEIMAMADGLALDDEPSATRSRGAMRHLDDDDADPRPAPRGRASFQDRVAAEQAPSAPAASERPRHRDQRLAVVGDEDGDRYDDMRVDRRAAAPAVHPDDVRVERRAAQAPIRAEASKAKTTGKPMSTVTFQQFVRDRLALRKSESRTVSRDEHDEPHLSAPQEASRYAPRYAEHNAREEAPSLRLAPTARPVAAEPTHASAAPERGAMRLRDRADIAAVRQELAAQLAMPSTAPAPVAFDTPPAVMASPAAASMPPAAAVAPVPFAPAEAMANGAPVIAAPVPMAAVVPLAGDPSLALHPAIMPPAAVAPVAAPVAAPLAASMPAPLPMMAGAGAPEAPLTLAGTTTVPAAIVPTMATLVDMLKPAAGADGVDVMSQLREMRGLISNQLSSLALHTDLQRDPVRTQLLRNLLGYGFSPLLVRKLIARLPSDYGTDEAMAWAAASLARLIRVVEPGQTLLDKGGIYAMTGPTGVGKTTTTAKLAAQFALRHGVGSIGLLTVDAYRIGAQDQLRTFGRLLGVPVHVVHDATGLAEFMNIFMNKKLVLIDTVGVGQRDERVSELLGSLASASINRLLVLNAAAQVETLDDVIGAYRADARTGVIVSKLDEAVKVGGVADCLIRHRLPLVGMADGQRVPEDWHFPDPAELVRRAMTLQANPVFDLDDNEMTLLLDTPSTRLAGTGPAGARSV